MLIKEENPSQVFHVPDGLRLKELTKPFTGKNMGSKAPRIICRNALKKIQDLPEGKFDHLY